MGAGAGGRQTQRQKEKGSRKGARQCKRRTGRRQGGALDADASHKRGAPGPQLLAGWGTCNSTSPVSAAVSRLNAQEPSCSGIAFPSPHTSLCHDAGNPPSSPGSQMWSPQQQQQYCLRTYQRCRFSDPSQTY